MASDRTDHAGLIRTLEEITRKVGAQSVLVSQTIAARVGLNPTDMECLDILHLAGPTTAGRLADETGLTTDAITAVIDRLERAGFARRADDPHDRRRVFVKALPKGRKVIAPLFESLAHRMVELYSGYKDHDLALILDYMRSVLAASTEHLRWLHELPAPTSGTAGGASKTVTQKSKTREQQGSLAGCGKTPEHALPG